MTTLKWRTEKAKRISLKRNEQNLSLFVFPFFVSSFLPLLAFDGSTESWS